MPSITLWAALTKHVQPKRVFHVSEAPETHEHPWTNPLWIAQHKLDAPDQSIHG